MTNSQLDVDALAQEIRRVDGKHDLGAGQLAEALMPFLSTLHGQQSEAVAATGYLFELCYSHRDDRWSGPMYSECLPKAEDVRNVRPLYEHPALIALPALRPLPVLGEEADTYCKSRGPQWTAAFNALREYRMTNMAWEDGEPGYPLVDLVSRDGDGVSIADGEFELVSIADEVLAALAGIIATPKPEGEE